MDGYTEWFHLEYSFFFFFFSVISVQCFENKQLFFAKKLNEAMKVLSVLLSPLKMKPFFCLLTDLINTSSYKSAILLQCKVGKSVLTTVLHQLL